MEKNRIILSGLLFLLLLTGCKEKDNSGGAPVNSAYNLTADSFNVSTQNLSNNDFTDELNNNDDFMYDDGDSTLDTCFEGKIGNFTFARNPDNSYRLSVPDTDLKDCFSSETVTYNSVVYSLFYDKVIAKDLDGNLVDLEGKKLSTVWDFTPTQILYRGLSAVNATFIGSGTRYEVDYVNSVHALTGFNDPCVDEGVDNCRTEDISKIHYINNPSYDYNDKSVLDTHSLEIVPGAPYYANGTITFAINNWSGTMTYGSDAYSAPTYTATSLGYTPVSGTYTPPPSPALKPETLSGAMKETIRKMIYRSMLK